MTGGRRMTCAARLEKMLRAWRPREPGCVAAREAHLALRAHRERLCADPAADEGIPAKVLDAVDRCTDAALSNASWMYY